jgi:hypothetical protein
LIADEFAGSQCDACFLVGHVGWRDRYGAADNLSLSTDRKGTLTWMENSLRKVRDLDDFEVQTLVCVRATLVHFCVNLGVIASFAKPFTRI